MNARRSIVLAFALAALLPALGTRIAAAQEQEIPPKLHW